MAMPVPQTRKDLFLSWRERARHNQIVHYAGARQMEMAHTWLGVPAVILSVVVGSSLFASLAKESNDTLKVLLGVASLAAAALAGLQSFLGCSEKAAQHQALGVAYGRLNRRLESIIASGTEPTADVEDEIRKALDELPSKGPGISQKLWDDTPKQPKEVP